MYKKISSELKWLVSLCFLFSTALVLAGGHQGGVSLSSAQQIIHAGQLLDRPGEPPRGESTIVIVDGRIVAVADGFRGADSFPEKLNLKEEVELLDLSSQFVLPGLMDAHVHIMAQPSAFVRNARSGGGAMSKSDLALTGALYAQRTLAAGFTTVRDVGSNDESVFALRDAINQGLLPGPTILAAGPILSATGGHGDKGFDASDSLEPDVRRADGVCDGAEECTRAVRHNIKLGADLIKFTATGGFMSSTGTQQQYEVEEMRAIVATAHQRGLKVAAHAYGAEAGQYAVDAGVDSIEHGWLLNEPALRKMLKQGTFLVPTLLISQPSAWANMAGTGKGAAMRDEYRAFETAYKLGVRIAFGTDVGIFDHGQNALEFPLMVELGMSPSDAIRSATVVTAELFGLDDQVGTIAVGKRADLIAVNGNPLEDIRQLQDVQFVMKNGTVVKRDGQYNGTVPVDPVGKAVSF